MPGIEAFVDMIKRKKNRKPADIHMNIRIRKLMLWSYEHPKMVMAVLLAATVFFACHIPAVSVEMSAKMLWIKDDPAIKLYDDTLETFGANKITVVFVKDSRLFTPKMLERLKAFQYALEKIPHVDRVDSLFTIAHVKSEAGVLRLDPFIKEVPDTIEKARMVKADALRDPLAAGNIVSADGSAMAFNLFLDKDITPGEQRRFSMHVDKAMEPVSPHVETVFQFGVPYLTRMFHENMVSDQRLIIPLAFVLLSLVSFLIWRSFSLTGLVMVTSGLSILWTTGFMGLFGLPMNIFTAITPALIIIIGSTEDIHLYSEYTTGLRKTRTRREAIFHMIEKISMPLFLTGLTTFLGFLAITVNKILILKQFGIVCAFGLFANPLITFLAAPVWLRYFGHRKTTRAGGPDSGRIQAVFSRLAGLINHLAGSHGRLTLGILAGSILLVGLFSFRIWVDNDLMRAFKPSSETRRNMAQLHEELADVRNFVIHIKSKIPDAFHRSKNLALIAKIQDSLGSKSGFDLTTSILDYLLLFHRQMRNTDESDALESLSPELIAQYLLIMPREKTEGFITNDASEVSIVVRYHATSTEAFEEIVMQTEDIAGKLLPPDFDFHITGDSILAINSIHTLVVGQVLSLSFILITALLLISLLFGDLKIGLLSLIPNVLPIIWLFGIMGLTGIDLNPGTAMIAVIAVGIAVDDTIHFMVCYHRKMINLHNRARAVEACIHHEIRPVTVTSLLLAAGFGMLMFSNLMPLVHLGFLGALVILVALITDLLITPIILSFG